MTGLGVAHTISDSILTHHIWSNYTLIPYLALIFISVVFIFIVYIILTYSGIVEYTSLAFIIGSSISLLIYISFVSYDIGSSTLDIANAQANYTSDDNIRISLDIHNRSGKGAVIDTIVVDFQEIEEGVACDSPLTDRFDFIIDDTIKPPQVKTIGKNHLLGNITVTLLDHISDILTTGDLRVQGWVNDECPNKQILIKVPVGKLINSKGSMQINLHFPKRIRYVETINSLIERRDILNHILQNPEFSFYHGFTVNNIGYIMKTGLFSRLSYPGVWISTAEISIEDQNGFISGGNMRPASKFIYVTLITEDIEKSREVEEEIKYLSKNICHN
jgi:hypothetical protein